jgi:virginiamycin A acetyltransferase
LNKIAGLFMNIISEKAIISPLADIEVSTKGSKVVIEAGTMIDSFVKIKFSGGSGDVVIGENCYINSGTVIYSGHGVTLGRGVLIASNCTLAAANHEYRFSSKPILGGGFIPSKGGIFIEDDVWVGANSVVLDGSVIRKGAVVGAGSLVRSELQEYGIYAGNPLKLLGRRGPLGTIKIY